MGLKLITAPAEEPITLAEAKIQCRIDSDLTDEDALVTGLIVAAREAAEHACGRALVTQTWELAIDAFPSSAVRLPKAPLIDIVSVTYVDSAGDSQVLDSSLYTTDTYQEPGWILPAVDTDWPDTYDTANAVLIRYRVGYGDAADVPEGIKAWVRLHLGTLYRNREAVVATTSNELGGRFFDGLLDPFRVYA